MHKRFLWFVFILLLQNLKAQQILFLKNNIGINVGANMAFGTHMKRLGLVVNAYYINDHIQLNTEQRIYFNAKNLGPELKYNEAVTSVGLLFAYGGKEKWQNPFLNTVSNQTGYRNSVAYSFNAYWNKIGTKQQTGLISLQFGKFSLITENDIFARKFLDRFRTGSFLFQWQIDTLMQVGINCTMWTGQMGHTHSITTSKIYPQCYMDTLDGKYTRYSHGLLSGQVKYNLGYSQNAQLNAGIDAEQIRDAVQNKWIHDMKFIPRKWQKVKNCHIPMVDKNGGQFLYQEGQEIRPARLFLNSGLNQSLFY